MVITLVFFPTLSPYYINPYFSPYISFSSHFSYCFCFTLSTSSKSCLFFIFFQSLLRVCHCFFDLDFYRFLLLHHLSPSSTPPVSFPSSFSTFFNISLLSHLPLREICVVLGENNVSMFLFKNVWRTKYAKWNNKHINIWINWGNCFY